MGESCRPRYYTDGSCLAWIGACALLLPKAGTGNLEAGPLAAEEAVLPAPSLPSVPEGLRRPSLSQLGLLVPCHLAGD